VEDDQLDAIRRRKLGDLQRAQQDRSAQEQYAQQVDAQKQAILRQILTPEARERLGRITLAYPDLAGSIEDQLVALAQSGRVNQVIDELRAGCGGRSIEFAVGRLGSAMADAALLKQVLANLLGNAIKFTRDKSPAVVEVGCRREAAAGGANVYYVKDNGAGFDMRYSDKLFGVFQRLHRAEEYEGTGVGLSIVQRVINRHGGRVWADSRPGEGATFYFTLQPGA